MRRLVFGVLSLALAAGLLSAPALAHHRPGHQPSPTPTVTPTLAVSSADTIHTIDRLVLDARGLLQPVKTRFEGKHGGTATEPYQIDLIVEKMSTTGSGGYIVFRELDPENYYQLQFRPTFVKLLKKAAGTATEVARGGTGFGATFNAYPLRVVLEGARIRIYEGTTVVVDWTDPLNSYPVGRNISYYAEPGALFCYESVDARPVSASLALGHASALGGVPGYTGPQSTAGTSAFIGSSRYPFTFERYDAPSDDGSLSQDMIEGGFDGNARWRLVWQNYGAQLVYRATSPGTNGLPRNGYAVRIEAAATRFGTLGSSGSFTQLASGRALLPGEDLYVDTTATTHTVRSGTEVILIATHSTYNGLRAYVGHVTGSGRLAGSFTPQ